jgi:hypothetical protein
MEDLENGKAKRIRDCGQQGQGSRQEQEDDDLI